MLVSVITPTFNSGEYLPGTVESVAGQSYPHIEHIVVDGGSTDGTLEILKTSRVKWKSGPDQGMYDAVNKGIRMSAGEVVCYLNADDRFFPGTVGAVVKELQAHPEVSLVFGYCAYTTPRGNTLATFRPSLSHSARRTRITFAQPATFWRRSVHEKVGYFDPAMKNAGDADFFHRIRAAGLQARLIRKPLAQFMVREDAISMTMLGNMRQEVASIYSQHKISRRSPRYLLNELSYYSMNADSYLRYVWNKRVRRLA